MTVEEGVSISHLGFHSAAWIIFGFLFCRENEALAVWSCAVRFQFRRATRRESHVDCRPLFSARRTRDAYSLAQMEV